MRKGLTRVAAPLLVIAACFGVPAQAHAAPKMVVDRHEDRYHYGVSAVVLVNASPSVGVSKVTSIVAHRTDWNAIAEIGHTWDYSSPPWAFYVWGEYGGYNIRSLGNVAAGTYHRYWTAWYTNSSYYKFWMDDVTTPKATVYLPSMTSSWSCLNAERVGDNVISGDNTACFQTLKYRNYDWGIWGDWNGYAFCDDDDPYHAFVRRSNTHHDVVRGY